MRGDRYSMSLTYGPRENEVLKNIDRLAGKNVLPANKNEILRRGLHSYKYLAKADEMILLDLLSNYLHRAVKDPDSPSFSIAKALSFVVYATMIAKYGLLRSEMFEAIPINLNLIEEAKVKTDQAQISNNIPHAIGELATSVDTVFLKRFSPYPLKQ
jgi:hypothetical protein